MANSYPKGSRSLQEISPSLEKLCQEFEVRQTFPQPKTKPEENRQKTQDFLAANWDRLWQVFYSQKEFSQEGQRNQPFHVFSNVNLGELGNVGLITIGSDGKIFIFDINRSLNKEQVEKYKQALISLAKVLGLSINSDNIRVFTVLPSFSASANTLIITYI